jgi:LPXTG-motif cell wall-anchored protein
MKNTCRLVMTFLVMAVVALTSVKSVEAVNLTLTPATKDATVGENFSVTIGIASGTEKVFAADIWTVFDASKLEIVSVDAVGGVPVFPFSLGDKNIDNSKGTFSLALMPLSGSGLGALPATGGLITVVFKAKAVGTGSFSFTCQTGSVNDTNVMNPDVVDVIDCATNASGLYTIKAASSGDGGSTVAATATPVPPTGTTGTSASLPQTGAVENTIMLLVGAVLAAILGVAVIKL